MGDRIGRRKVFILTALNVALATGIMYFTPGQGGWIAGWIFLSFFRFFVGFGNAGLIAVDIPLVQEFVPAYKRGWVSGLTTTLLPATFWVRSRARFSRRSSAGAACSWSASSRRSWY
jgi:putative MFS transporter